MAKLHYVSVMSLDGYIGDGRYDWSLPTEGSTAFITEVIRPFGTYLYGRKNYETMSFWETPEVENMGTEDQEFGRVWRSAEKIIYSKKLHSVKTQKTRIENDFNVQKIREMKKKSSKDLCIGGPTIAGLAIRNDLVDELHLFIVPTTIGSSIPVIPVLPRGFADWKIQSGRIFPSCPITSNPENKKATLRAAFFIFYEIGAGDPIAIVSDS